MKPTEERLRRSFRQHMLKRLICIFLFFSVILSGCTSLYQVDLEADRRKNLMRDTEFLNARETMTFTAPLTLDDVIRIGLENNLDLRISQIMEEISDDESLASKLKMLPSLELDAVHSRRNNYSITGYIDPETGESTTAQDKTTKTLDLELSWSILDFGLSYIRARQAAFSAEVRRMERIRQAQMLAFDIATAYWKSVLAERNLKYVQRIKEKVMAFRKKAELLVAHRRLDPIVAKEMEKQWASLSISASNIQAQISGMRIELCRLMGLTPMTRFELAEANLDEFLSRLPSPETLDPRKLEIISLYNRPELFSADLEQRLKQEEARAALVSMFPGLSFSFNYYYNANKYLYNNDWYTIGTELTSSLLALPAKYVEWKAKKKSVSVAEFQRLLLSAGVIAQVHMSLHDYRIQKESFELQNNSYRISEELLDMSRVKNEAGTKGFTDVSITEKMLSTLIARLGRDQNLISLLSSYNMLLVTMGLEYERWGLDLDKVAVDIMPNELVPDKGKEKNELDKTPETSAPHAFNRIQPLCYASALPAF